MSALLASPGVGSVGGSESVPALNGQVWLGFRPEAVEMGPDTVNSFPTRIRHVSYLGEIEQYHLELRSGALIKAFEQNPREIRLAGTPLPVHVHPRNLLVLPC